MAKNYPVETLVKDNIILNCSKYGIFIYWSNGSLVAGNIIFIRGRRSSEVMGNFLINNTYGIFIDWSSNKIYSNNFVNNSNNAYVNGNIESIWDGDYPLGGNYWGRLSGTDFYKGPYQNELVAMVFMIRLTLLMKQFLIGIL
jgi:parallel beta-helix repeat protein